MFLRLVQVIARLKTSGERVVRTLTDLGKGTAAAVVASLILSGLLLIKEAFGLMLEMNPIRVISAMTGHEADVLARLVHLLIGTLLSGALFAWLQPALDGPMWLRGLRFASGTWLMMRVVLMPILGSGLFALKLGIAAPMTSFLMHTIFGATLGSTYGVLTPCKLHAISQPPRA